MKRLPLIVLPLAVLLVCSAVAVRAGANTADPVQASISLDQTAPAFGQPVTFTVTYPSVARKKIGQRIPFNPVVAITCFQAGVHVYTSNALIATEQAVGQGWWQGVTQQMPMDSTSNMAPNAAPWTSGGAYCDATLGYWSKNQDGSFAFTGLADTSFAVGA